MDHKTIKNIVMRNLHLKLSGIVSFIFCSLIFIYRRQKNTAYIYICFLIICLSGCYHSFYRTNTKPTIDAPTVSKLKSENKYFIVHYNNGINGLEEV